MVGILVSFWEGNFSGAMLVSGRVINSILEQVGCFFSMTSMTIGYDIVVLGCFELFYCSIFTVYFLNTIDSICFYLHLFIENQLDINIYIYNTPQRSMLLGCAAILRFVGDLFFLWSLCRSFPSGQILGEKVVCNNLISELEWIWSRFG